MGRDAKAVSESVAVSGFTIDAVVSVGARVVNVSDDVAGMMPRPMRGANLTVLSDVCGVIIALLNLGANPTVVRDLALSMNAAASFGAKVVTVSEALSGITRRPSTVTGANVDRLRLFVTGMTVPASFGAKVVRASVAVPGIGAVSATSRNWIHAIHQSADVIVKL